MQNLKTSSKKLQVIHTAIRLFVTYGFHTTGVDLIIKEAKITKATFYNYFHSKERLIEMCIAFQKKPAERRSTYHYLLKSLPNFKGQAQRNYKLTC